MARDSRPTSDRFGFTKSSHQYVPPYRGSHSFLQNHAHSVPESKMDVIKFTSNLPLAELERVAVTIGEKSYTYGDILHSAYQTLSCLVQKNETAEPTSCADHKSDGPRIGIMAKPCPEFVAAIWAAWLNGAVIVPLALSFPESELMHVITDAEISIILATDEYREFLEKLIGSKLGLDSVKLCILPPVQSPVALTDNFQKLRADDRLSTQTAGNDGGAALMIYTSGTTGRPKGVVHTHKSLGAQVRMISEAWEFTTGDRLLHCLPLHHVHGLINAVLTPLYVGAAIEFLPKFSTSGVWQRWREAALGLPPITIFTGVPTMYIRLLQGYRNMDAETQRASANAAGKLRVMLCASSALPEPVMDEWEAITGHRLVERYGMTEFGMGLSNPLHGEKRAGFVGMPLPGTEIKVDVTNSNVKNVGELLFKTPSMFREYWGQPQVTRDSFTEDGFFKTGDTVTIVDGFVKILGRTSVDILMVGGYKLSALEIEAVLLQHPSIAECAVFGFPDKEYGEVVCVVMVPSQGTVTDLTLKDLQMWAVEKIASYKLPKKLLIWDNMPRNAMGKVNKKELIRTILESTPSATLT